MNWSPNKIRLAGLQKGVHVRKYTYGPRPKIKSKEAEGAEGAKVESKWMYKTLEQTDQEKSKMLGSGFEIRNRQALSSMSTHLEEKTSCNYLVAQ